MAQVKGDQLVKTLTNLLNLTWNHKKCCLEDDSPLDVEIFGFRGWSSVNS